MAMTHVESDVSEHGCMRQLDLRCKANLRVLTSSRETKDDASVERHLPKALLRSSQLRGRSFGIRPLCARWLPIRESHQDRETYSPQAQRSEAAEVSQV